MIISPAISVTIPLYNAENYIAECLESILNQTFQDFEVIVVDDCSTDNSRAIVESYAPKFDGRLKLFSTEKNSGSGSLPRNKGMIFSRGEYIFFVDDDDLIIPTALEELYVLAEDYAADVVHCEKNYFIRADALAISENGRSIVAPEIETEDLAVRVQGILQDCYNIPQWSKLVRRDFIYEKELFFPLMRHADDIIWTYGLIFLSKRFLNVPNIVYCQRLIKNSIMQRPRTPQQEISFWLNPIILGTNELDKLMNKIEFFKQNPKYRCAVLENFVHIMLAGTLEKSHNLSLPDTYEIIKQEFGKSLGEQNVLISFLLADLIEQQKIFVRMSERTAELEKK
jgi:glycosyltransferase involved in cell wall biosynthesis